MVVRFNDFYRTSYIKRALMRDNPWTNKQTNKQTLGQTFGGPPHPLSRTQVTTLGQTFLAPHTSKPALRFDNPLTSKQTKLREVSNSCRGYKNDRFCPGDWSLSPILNSLSALPRFDRREKICQNLDGWLLATLPRVHILRQFDDNQPCCRPKSLLILLIVDCSSEDGFIIMMVKIATTFANNFVRKKLRLL